MLYLVRMDVNIPADMPADELKSLQAEEKKYSQGLQRDGRYKSIWRVAGQYANYSVFDVSSHDELHDLLSGLPLFRFITTQVTPLAQHPNAIDQ